MKSKAMERMNELKRRGLDKIRLLRNYADYLEGTNGHTPRDPGTFYEVDDMPAELQQIGEELAEISQEIAKLEEELPEIYE